MPRVMNKEKTCRGRTASHLYVSSIKSKSFYPVSSEQPVGQRFQRGPSSNWSETERKQFSLPNCYGCQIYLKPEEVLSEMHTWNLSQLVAIRFDASFETCYLGSGKTQLLLLSYREIGKAALRGGRADSRLDLYRNSADTEDNPSRYSSSTSLGLPVDRRCHMKNSFSISVFCRL